MTVQTTRTAGPYTFEFLSDGDAGTVRIMEGTTQLWVSDVIFSGQGPMALYVQVKRGFDFLFEKHAGEPLEQELRTIAGLVTIIQ